MKVDINKLFNKLFQAPEKWGVTETFIWVTIVVCIAQLICK